MEPEISLSSSRQSTSGPYSATNEFRPHSKTHLGRAVAQAITRWLPISAARVRARVKSCGICSGESGTGGGFFRVLRFPLPIFIPPIAPQSPSPIIWGWYNRPEVTAVPSGLSLTPLTIILVIIKSHLYIIFSSKPESSKVFLPF
jgi:hypothetical protein